MSEQPSVNPNVTEKNVLDFKSLTMSSRYFGQLVWADKDSLKDLKFIGWVSESSGLSLFISFIGLTTNNHLVRVREGAVYEMFMQGPIPPEYTDNSVKYSDMKFKELISKLPQIFV